MAHPVAHEGNPRFDDITITGGSVLSIATLEIELPGPAQSIPLFAPPVELGGGGCGSCEEQIITTRAVAGCASDIITDSYIATSYSPADSSLNGTADNCSAALAATLFDSTTKFDISVRSGQGGCPLAGYSIWETISGSHEEINIRAKYEGATLGTPISGFTFCVQPGSSVCDFTGYVCLYDHLRGNLTFGYYLHQSLMDGTLTTLASTAIVGVGTELELFASTEAGPTFDEFEFTNDRFSSLLFSYPDLSAVTPAIIPWTRKYGFIWVGTDATGTHEARWTDHTGFTSIISGP